jgi:hypothetical protein
MSTKKLTAFAGFIFTLTLLLAACQGGQANLPVTGQEDLAPAVQAVLDQASQQLGVNVQDIEITTLEQVDWPDACLGLPQGDEACAQVVTPGFRVELQVNNQTFEFRTDESGTIIRQAP